MHKILVTGAGGFVGGAVVEALAKVSGVDVCAVCRRAPDSLERVAAASVNVHVLDGLDLTDPKDVAQLPGGLSHVVHCMAQASFAETDETVLRRNNVDATRMLMNHVEKTSADTIKRFLFTSSIGVHDRPILSSSRDPLTETSPLRPASHYCRSKLECEELLRRSRLPVVTARLGWVYGPSMRETSHIRTFARMSSKGHPVSRIDLPGRIMPAYIVDTGKALAALLLKDTLARDVYLVAHPDPVSIGAIFSLCHRILTTRRLSMMPSWLLRPFRFVGILFPMQVRCVLEDYLVCRVDNLSKEGIFLTTPFASGLRRSIEKGSWGFQALERENETILITGAASGLGRALAEEAHVRGYSLCLVDIDPAIAGLADQLVAEYKILDLAEADAVEAVLDWDREVTVVINNAGVGWKDYLHKMPPEWVDKVLNVNVMALTRLSKAFLERFVAKGTGTLVNICSTAFLFSTPTMAPYGGSKAYVNAFTDALISEYRETPGICVIGISPSGINTAFQSRAGVPNDRPERLLIPSLVANRILDRIAAGRSGQYYIGLSAWVFMLAKRILGARFYRHLTARLFLRYR